MDAKLHGDFLRQFQPSVTCCRPAVHPAVAPCASRRNTCHPGPCARCAVCATLRHRQPDRVDPIPNTELSKSKRQAPRTVRRPRKIVVDQPGTFTPLTTERLTLRPLHPNDAEALHRLINDWEVTRTLAELPYPYPRE